jgi:hypothetical protein
MNTAILTEELELLNAQIGGVRQKIGVLEDELRSVEAELDTFAEQQQRIDALRDVGLALDQLDVLGAAELFWNEVLKTGHVAGYQERLREHLAGFDEEIRDTRERQADLQARIDLQLDELDLFNEELLDAYAREERRLDEFAIEREISPLVLRDLVMPWTTRSESERLFRRSLLAALLFSLLFGSIIPLINLPLPDRSAVIVEIPERLAMLVKKEPPLPEPVPERPREEKKPEADTKPPEKTAKNEKPDKPEQPKNLPKSTQPKAAPAAQVARKKAEKVGVLAFKSSFSDLIDEVPIAKLGNEARFNKKAPLAAGQAQARRSLVAMQAKNGSSGGIDNAGVSRNLGYGVGDGNGGNGVASRIGGLGYTKVESAVAGLAEASRPLSDGPGPGRTDEEIQIVFDRYKAALYRIYNTELRKNPTLRGKMLLRVTIEPGGEVSACAVEATDLDSDELVSLIVERVRRFNFGPKDDVPKLTILYPIDFLPAS